MVTALWPCNVWDVSVTSPPFSILEMTARLPLNHNYITYHYIPARSLLDYLWVFHSLPEVTGIVKDRIVTSRLSQDDSRTQWSLAVIENKGWPPVVWPQLEKFLARSASRQETCFLCHSTPWCGDCLVTTCYCDQGFRLRNFRGVM